MTRIHASGTEKNMIHVSEVLHISIYVPILIYRVKNRIKLHHAIQEMLAGTVFAP